MFSLTLIVHQFILIILIIYCKIHIYANKNYY